MNDQRKDIREVMEEYDRLNNIPIDVTNSITHADFVTGVRDKTVGVAFCGEPSQILKGADKIIFNFFVMLYVVAPPLIVPLWAYHESNWWLLIGIAASWLSTVATARFSRLLRKGNSFGAFLLIACISFWAFQGIHNYFTFFVLSALWGNALFLIAETAQRDYALQSLVDSPELFEKVVSSNVVRIVRKRDIAT